MTWAGKRQFLIIGGLVLALLIISGIGAFVTFYQAPSCMNGKQDRDEQGIDCGGTMCTYLCTALQKDPNPPRFTRVLPPVVERTDIITYIDNPNEAAAKAVSYTLTLYDANASVITKKTGSVDIAPSGVVTPLFIPNAYRGPIPVVRAFLELDTDTLRWYMPRTNLVLTARNVQISETQLPRVTASVHNPSANALRNVKVVATVFDRTGNAMAASQTVIEEVPAQGDVPVVFTWNLPFSEPAGRIEIVPIAPLKGPR